MGWKIGAVKLAVECDWGLPFLLGVEYGDRKTLGKFQQANRRPLSKQVREVASIMSDRFPDLYLRKVEWTCK